MNKLIWVGVIAAGLAAGWVMPKASASDPGFRTAQVTQAGDGHFYTTAQVDGREVRFLVDTGSSLVTLTEEDARKMGLSVDPAKYELLGKGPSGLVRGTRMTLKEIEIDGIVQHDVAAAVVEGSDVSLLGQPFLNNLDEIVIRRGEMTLRSRA